MKKETRLNKLAELLGIKTEVEVHVEKSNNRNKYIEVPEDKIQDLRTAQGVIYFLQAPELFSMKICKWRECQQPFAVSRQFIAFCSYTCIKDSLADIGIDWNRNDTSDAEKIEMTINTVYEGQEPIWLREPILSKLRTLLNTLPDEGSSLLTTPPTEQPTSLPSPSSVDLLTT